MKTDHIIDKAIGYICITLGSLAVVLGILYPHAWHNLFLGAGFVWLGKIHLDEAKEDERRDNTRDA